MKFIIEHLEPELYDWCLIEYEHISEIVGKENLFFTNISDKKDADRLKKFGAVYEKNISQLNFEKICVLSQYAEKTVSASDKKDFEYFVFGGILGDNPAKKRTDTIIKDLKNSGKMFEERNLGKSQMPTDVAVYATKQMLNGKKLSDFKFVDKLEIEIDEDESVELDFRYIVDGNKPIISEKLVEYIRNNKGF
ncbi:MAG: SAM-dependent methyltransferase [Nanoarchaeota archaeon]